MQVLELLSLPLEKESIKKIDRFLTTVDETKIEYFQAKCYKALIYNEIGKPNDALKLLMGYEEKFESLDKDIIVCITDTLKKIFMSLGRYEYALKYINIKEKALSYMAHDEYYKDMILYNLALHNDVDTKRYLLLYLADDISEENRIFAYEILIEFQYKDKDYNGFYESYDILKEYYKSVLNEDALLKIEKYKANIIYENNDTLEAIEYLKKLLNSLKNNTDKLTYATKLILLYLKQNDTHHASIVDANYSDCVDAASQNAKREYYLAIKELYERMNNRFSLDLAIKGLEALNETKEETEEINPVEKPKKKEKSKRISEPIVIEKIVEAPKKEETNFVSVVPVEESISYIKLEPFINRLNLYNDTEELRDVLRDSLMLVTDFIKFEEVHFFIKNEDDFKGYYYKAKRLYDKVFNNSDVYKKSIPFRSFELNKALVMTDIADIYYNMSITTEKISSYNAAVSIPLNYKNEVFGSITYYGDKAISENFNFEMLNIISSMLNLRMNSYFYHDEVINKETLLNFINSKMPYGIMLNYDGLLKLNAKAIDMLKLSDTSLENDLYEDLIVSKDRVIRHSLMLEILSGRVKEKKLDYNLADNTRIREHLYLNCLSDHYLVVSIIENITDDYKLQEKYHRLSEKDKFTPLDSLEKLKETIKILNEVKKYSFVMINAYHFKLYKDVYGLKFSLDLIKAISLKLIEILQSYKGQAYHFDSDKFIIILPNNDERTVKKQVLQILNELTVKLNELNSRIKLYFRAGIVLVRSYTSKTDYNSLIEAASLTLDELQSNVENENIVLYYDSKAASSSFYDFQMELHISEAIDNQLIKLRYLQIVNMKERKLFGYEALVNLENTLVDPKYFEEIVAKRHLEESIDKYLIQKSILELKDFYEAYGGYFKVFIKIHTSTIATKNFLKYLEEKYKFYKIPRSLFSFELVDNGGYDIKNNTKALIDEHIMVGSSSLDIVLSNKLSIYFCDYSNKSKEELNAIKELCKNLNIELILTNVNDKNELESIKDYSLVKGKIFDKNFTIEEIIEGINKKKI